MTKVEVPTSRLERLVGRSLAMSVHPYAAWRAHRLGGRLFVFFTYFALSYAVVLGVLFLSY